MIYVLPCMEWHHAHEYYGTGVNRQVNTVGVGLSGRVGSPTFRTRLKCLPGAVIARDVKSGVHSCAILGYFSIGNAVYFDVL